MANVETAFVLGVAIPWNLATIKGVFENTSVQNKGLDAIQFQLFFRKIGFPRAIFNSTLLSQRLFKVVDSGNLNAVNWNEAKKTLQLLSSKNVDLLLKFGFKIFDLDGIREITQHDMNELLPLICKALAKTMNQELPPPFDTNENVDTFISKLYAKLRARNQPLDIKEYKKLAEANETMMLILTFGSIISDSFLVNANASVPSSTPESPRNEENIEQVAKPSSAVAPDTKAVNRETRTSYRVSNEIQPHNRPGSPELYPLPPKRPTSPEIVAKSSNSDEGNPSARKYSAANKRPNLAPLKEKESPIFEEVDEEEEYEEGEEIKELKNTNAKLVQQVLALQKALKEKIEKNASGESGEGEAASKIKHLQSELKESMAREVQLENKITELEAEKEKQRDIMRRMKTRIKLEIKKRTEESEANMKKAASISDIHDLRKQCESQILDYHLVSSFLMKVDPVPTTATTNTFPPPVPGNVIKVTLLNKKGGIGEGRFAKWQRRCANTKKFGKPDYTRFAVMINDGSILYWAKEDSPKPRGVLESAQVTGIRVASGLDVPQNTLEIFTGQRAWMLSFDTKHEMEDWRDSIMRLIKPTEDDIK